MFLLLKWSASPFRLSDTAGYFVLGQYILEGKLLYKDMFFTNLPLFGYISALYVFITGYSLQLFTEISALEAGICAFLLVLLLRKEQVSISFQCLITVIYLFSSLVFASTEFNTGTLTATLFALTGFYLYRNSRFPWSAILFGLSFTTKGYTLPIIVAVLLYDTFLRKLQSWTFWVPFTVTVFIVLSPTLLLVPSDFVNNVFGYTISRPENIDRWPVLRLFLLDNWLYILSALVSLFRFPKHLLLNGIIACTLLFLALYQDSYYFYYNIALPFIVLTIPATYNYLTKRFPFEITTVLFIALCGVSLVLHMQSYLAMANTVLIKEPEKLVEAVQKANPDYIYGIFDGAPLVSYLSGKPLLNGLIDTNAKLFEKNVYSTSKVTNDIVTRKTLLVVYGQSDGPRKRVVENAIADFARVKNECLLYYEHPITAAYSINRIFLIKCYD